MKAGVQRHVEEVDAIGPGHDPAHRQRLRRGRIGVDDTLQFHRRARQFEGRSRSFNSFRLAGVPVLCIGPSCYK